MRRNESVIIKLPKLFDAGGDPTKKWQITYYARNPKNGRLERFRVNEGLGPNPCLEKKKATANQKLEELTKKLKAGWTPFEKENVIYENELRYRHVSQIYRTARAGNNTVMFLSSEYMKTLNFKKAEATIQTYRSKLRIFCAWLDFHGYAANDVTAISNDIILDFFNYLINERKLSGNTIKKFKEAIYNMFEYVCETKKLRFNPVLKVPSCNRKNDQAPIPILEDDLIELKNVISKEDPQLWLAFQFEFYCAIRPGRELRFLRIQDLDLFNGYAYVTTDNSKTGRKRGVVIPKVFCDILKKELEPYLKNKSDYVISHNGKPGPTHLGKNTLRYRFNKFRKRLNMNQMYKFYSGKHTGALKMLRNGFTIDEISHHLGHSNKISTEHYIKNKFGWEPERVSRDYPVL